MLAVRHKHTHTHTHTYKHTDARRATDYKALKEEKVTIYVIDSNGLTKSNTAILPTFMVTTKRFALMCI